MKKKGVFMVLEVLLSLMLVSALFMFTFGLIGGCIRTSAQAEEDFGKLANTVETMHNAEPGTARSQLVRVDKKTGIFIFPKDAGHVVVQEEEKTPRDATFERPAECETGKACMCRCTSLKIADEGRHADLHKAMVCDGKLQCRLFKGEVSGICEIEDKPERWSCTEGVFIGREVEFGKNVWFDVSRTRLVRIEKAGSAVFVCENPDPVRGCVPEQWERT